uniref:Uncharacterized protein n=1 Tax=viral metagenome TaxID=1070528 RepID=A0A6C0CTR6_9ZZZZ
MDAYLPIPNRIHRSQRFMVSDGIYYEEHEERDPNHAIVFVQWIRMPMPEWLTPVIETSQPQQ